ncbi:hypothetical protein KFL_000430110 [Klebsormidium nitens]|uniref:Uncharacterized protein n=1 Tax=Klebsormidium nitens TaxID=105231 RepID=A0A1Y1HS19_KLENI|nr:hypothetical protein KFL_000430110 [Klebsormidium nitens]|eukprot:GAQ79969.1 hypothetical protein KFL_000430110 [Klebsormidium nitens]
MYYAEQAAEQGPRSKPSQMKAIDFAFRSVTAGLGVATIALGAGLIVNVISGLSYHAAVPKPEQKLNEQERS